MLNSGLFGAICQKQRKRRRSLVELICAADPRILGPIDYRTEWSAQVPSSRAGLPLEGPRSHLLDKSASQILGSGRLINFAMEGLEREWSADPTLWSQGVDSRLQRCVSRLGCSWSCRHPPLAIHFRQQTYQVTLTVNSTVQYSTVLACNKSDLSSGRLNFPPAATIVPDIHNQGPSPPTSSNATHQP
ncbi:hypothetical protein BGZ63DRAFT_41092 [Mariannaea sp. PMI_226]|nr:hypothetical protein BGZ63DRAFT_41092 [Mariannaea sp. PMI_226]